MKKNIFLNQVEQFWLEEDGVGVVEIILILVVLIALVLIFRTKISKMVEDAFNKATQDADEIIGE